MKKMSEMSLYHTARKHKSWCRYDTKRSRLRELRKKIKEYRENEKGKESKKEVSFTKSVKGI